MAQPSFLFGRCHNLGSVNCNCVLQNIPVPFEYFQTPQEKNGTILFWKANEKNWLPSRAPACWVTLWRHWREMLQPKPTPPSSFFFFLCFLFTCSLRCSFFLTSSFFKLYLHPVALVHDPLGATCSSPITTADVGLENVRMGLFNKDLSRIVDDGTGMHGT